jgi:hypothetical protein
MTTISIALAAYNGERYLSEQLESLAKQTRLPDELVISDDASTDDTVSIVEKFAAHAPFPVKYYRNPERLGWARNFVRTAQLCSSELIAFCDQDDVWLPTKIERCCAFFLRPDIYLAYHDAVTVDATLVPYGRLTRLPIPSCEGTALDVLPFRNPYGFTMVFRSRLLRYCRLYDQSMDHDRPGQPMAHDQFFFFLGSALKRIRYIPELLVNYRQHGGNAVGPGVRLPLSYRLRGITSTQCTMIALASESRCRMLAQMIGIAPEEESGALEALQKRYVQLAERYRLRAIVHGEFSLGRRVAALLHIGPRAYLIPPWGFGWKALLKDTFSALETSFVVTVEHGTAGAFRKLRSFLMSVGRADRR